MRAAKSAAAPRGNGGAYNTVGIETGRDEVKPIGRARENEDESGPDRPVARCSSFTGAGADDGRQKEQYSNRRHAPARCAGRSRDHRNWYRSQRCCPMFVIHPPLRQAAHPSIVEQPFVARDVEEAFLDLLEHAAGQRRLSSSLSRMRLGGSGSAVSGESRMAFLPLLPARVGRSRVRWRNPARPGHIRRG